VFFVAAVATDMDAHVFDHTQHRYFDLVEHW
jgi:hypothetical protein